VLGTVDSLVTQDVCVSVGKHCLYVDTTHDVSFNVQFGFFSLGVAGHCTEHIQLDNDTPANTAKL